MKFYEESPLMNTQKGNRIGLMSIINYERSINETLSFNTKFSLMADLKSSNETSNQYLVNSSIPSLGLNVNLKEASQRIGSKMKRN